MLQELRVQNLALIDTLHLDLSNSPTGLIVLTGETGAGKSIILQAINLLTGGRGNASWVRSDCKQAGIEALFSFHPDHEALGHLLQEHSLNHDGNCLIRRMLSDDGRSRIYVNDHSVTARLATELGACLVNIASQHDQQQLLNVRSHLDYLDTYGELWGERRAFTAMYRKSQAAEAERQKLVARVQDREQRRDFLRFQLEEICKVQPKAGEDEMLRQERERLKASDVLSRLSRASCRQLEESVLSNVNEIRKAMEQAADIDPELVPLTERIRSASLDLEDMAAGLRDYTERLSGDPERLDTIAERLAELKQLQRKYGSTVEDVLAFAGQAETELAELGTLEDQIAEAESKLATLTRQTLQAARALSLARQAAKDRLCAAMERELASLNFHQAVFQVHLTTAEDQAITKALHAEGGDQVEFLFSANPGEPPKPLVRIISGGELSRLTLAMKCLLARRDQVDTVIFDEIDAGISGQTAEAVAAKISELAEHHQVFCITHLPQIAACADLHFCVEKQVRDNRTRTRIFVLDEPQRRQELARMLSGERPGPQTLAFAEELIRRRKKEHREISPKE